MDCSILSLIELPVLFRWTKAINSDNVSKGSKVELNYRGVILEAEIKSRVWMFFLHKCAFLGWILVCWQNGKKLARLLQLILVTFIIFIILDNTSELRALKARFLKDLVNSSLIEQPESDSDHKQEQEQEPAPRTLIFS